jgi:hypothetical protein
MSFGVIVNVIIKKMPEQSSGIGQPKINVLLIIFFEMIQLSCWSNLS